MSNPTGKGGFQERKHQINRSGRPGKFDELQKLTIEIFHEPAISNGQELVINGHRVTQIEAIIRKWIMSGNPALQQKAVEIAFGKVPDNVDITSGGLPLKVTFEYAGDNDQTDRTED